LEARDVMHIRTVLFALSSAAACSASPQPAVKPAAETRLFAMQSNFW
jgi:hypothetical protein